MLEIPSATLPPRATEVSDTAMAGRSAAARPDAVSRVTIITSRAAGTVAIISRAATSSGSSDASVVRPR